MTGAIFRKFEYYNISFVVSKRNLTVEKVLIDNDKKSGYNSDN